MNSRERVYAALDFTGPDRLPTDLWALPSTWYGRAEAVNALLAKYPCDFGGVAVENAFDITGYTAGTLVDCWGCEWVNLQDGVIGEVKTSPLASYDRLSAYRWPDTACGPLWEQAPAALAAQRDKFVLGWAGDPFERMQFLRGPANLYEDLGDPDCAAVYDLRDRVFALVRQYAEHWVRLDVDAVSISDDWGSQRGLLISPAKWREFFKPKYREIFEIVKSAGKKLFFHSDGHIADIYPDLIELGVDALNSQVWCMGLDRLAPFAGQVTFWGELDRQYVLPRGTPAEVRKCQQQMVDTFYRNGGLIGQSSVDKLNSLASLEAAVAGWWDVKLPRG